MYRRVEFWYYEFLGAVNCWRNRTVIGLVREFHGLPRRRSWKARAIYSWKVLAG